MIKDRRKQLLTVEFRYNDIPRNGERSGYTKETLTIGIYDSLEEAVEAGNNTLEIFSEFFDFGRDRFKVKGLFGAPEKLVTNKTGNIFAKITTLHICDDAGELRSFSQKVLEAKDRYKKYLGRS